MRTSGARGKQIDCQTNAIYAVQKNNTQKSYSFMMAGYGRDNLYPTVNQIIHFVCVCLMRLCLTLGAQF